MHYLFFLLLSVFPTPRAAPPAAVVRFSPISAAAYAQGRRQTRPAVAPVTFLVRKRNGQLIIPTSKGPQVYRDVVVDEASIRRGIGDEATTTYTYRGFLTRFQRHVVEVNFYETSEWWLIGNDGRRLTLYGPPQYSPDQQSIATICPGLEYSGGQPNALQLFRLQDGMLRKAWELRPENWEPAEIFWLNNNTLYLKRETWTVGANGNVSYWKMSFQQTD